MNQILGKVETGYHDANWICTYSDRTDNLYWIDIYTRVLKNGKLGKSTMCVEWSALRGTTRTFSKKGGKQ